MPAMDPRAGQLFDEAKVAVVVERYGPYSRLIDIAASQTSRS